MGKRDTHCVVKRSWQSVCHEGDEASCRRYIDNCTSLGFERRSDLVVVSRDDRAALRDLGVGR